MAAVSAAAAAAFTGLIVVRHERKAMYERNQPIAETPRQREARSHRLFVEGKEKEWGHHREGGGGEKEREKEQKKSRGVVLFLWQIHPKPLKQDMPGLTDNFLSGRRGRGGVGGIRQNLDIDVVPGLMRGEAAGAGYTTFSAQRARSSLNAWKNLGKLSN